MADLEDFFRTASAKVPHFGSGEVASILELPPWKLHRILTRYQLTSAGQLGQGRGSRRWFTTEDIYRIATALFLIQDGFGPKIVSSIVQTIGDSDFYGDHDEHGEFSQLGVWLQRTKEGRQVRTFRSDAPPELRIGGSAYYALSLDQITRTIDRRIREIRQHRSA